MWKFNFCKILSYFLFVPNEIQDYLNEVQDSAVTFITALFPILCKYLTLKYWFIYLILGMKLTRI